MWDKIKWLLLLIPALFLFLIGQLFGGKKSVVSWVKKWDKVERDVSNSSDRAVMDDLNNNLFSRGRPSGM